MTETWRKKGLWREVEHIEERKGTKGGAYWALRLTCGHTSYRPCPPFQRFRRGNKTNTVTLIAPVPLAPKRVRCLICFLSP